MSMTSDQLLAALGETEELSGGGARVLLPEGGYIMSVNVEDVDATGFPSQSGEPLFPEVLDDEGNPIPKGGTPFAKVTLEVTEGPFAENSIQPRLYLTPGKGQFIGWLNNAVKSITGKPADVGAFKSFGINPQGDEPSEVQASVRDGFFKLDVASRVAFMQMYARLGEWSGRTAVVMVGLEDPREIRDEATGTVRVVQYNRVLGFYPLNHAKKGQKWVRTVEFPRQQEEFDALQG